MICAVLLVDRSLKTYAGSGTLRVGLVASLYAAFGLGWFCVLIGGFDSDI